MDFGPKLRELRLEREFTQRGLAERAELTHNAVALIERGINLPTATTIDKLSRALGIDPGELFKDPSRRESKSRPKVHLLPKTPLTNAPVAEHNAWLESTTSADAVDSRLRELHVEAEALDELIPYIHNLRDRARLFEAAYRDRWVKLADDRRDPISNVFKSVEDVASELGGRYKPYTASEAAERGSKEEEEPVTKTA
jgi:transcriptional regulator with XRE-family HTH domain